MKRHKSGERADADAEAQQKHTKEDETTTGTTAGRFILGVAVFYLRVKLTRMKPDKQNLREQQLENVSLPHGPLTHTRTRTCTHARTRTSDSVCLTRNAVVRLFHNVGRIRHQLAVQALHAVEDNELPNMVPHVLRVSCFHLGADSVLVELDARNASLFA